MTVITTQPKVRPEVTYNVSKILTNLAIVKIHTESLANESYIGGTTKNMLKRVATRTDMAIKEVTGLLTDEGRAVIESELLSTDFYLQIDTINTILIAVPKSIRQQIEDYATGLYNVYCLNEGK